MVVLLLITVFDLRSTSDAIHARIPYIYLGYIGDQMYPNLAGYPIAAFPAKFEKDHGFLMPRPQMMAGRAYDESTLLALADAYQRAIGLKERPPLEKFLPIPHGPPATEPISAQEKGD